MAFSMIRSENARGIAEIPGNPAEDVSVGVDAQFLCCLGNCYKGVFSCCFRIGVCLQTDVLPAL